MLMAEPVRRRSFTCQSASAGKYNPREEIITCRSERALCAKCVRVCVCAKCRCSLVGVQRTLLCVALRPQYRKHSQELVRLLVDATRSSAARWHCGAAAARRCLLCCFCLQWAEPEHKCKSLCLSSLPPPLPHFLSLSLCCLSHSVRTVMPIIKRRGPETAQFIRHSSCLGASSRGSERVHLQLEGRMEGGKEGGRRVTHGCIEVQSKTKKKKRERRS